MRFDGPNKLIILEKDEPLLSIKELYYNWKQWSADIQNIMHPLALRYVGGDNILDRKLGITYFLTNGWKIKPFSANYTLAVDGNIYSDDGSKPFIKADGDVNVLIINTVSNLIDIIPLNVYNNKGKSPSMNNSNSINAESDSSDDGDWTLTQ